MKNLIDLHTHSVLSNHAFSSISENIEYASKLGLKVYGISEHQYDIKNVGANSICFLNMPRVVPDYYQGMRVLKGIELNILDDGFDVSKIKVSILDYCIASIHTYMYSKDHTCNQNTENYIKAIHMPYVKILGHIDSSAYPCDYETVIQEAKDNHVLIELNNASLDPNSSRIGAREIDKTILSICKKKECPIIVNSDAHIKYDIGQLDNAYQLLEEVDFPNELIVNYDLDKLNQYIPIYEIRDKSE